MIAAPRLTLTAVAAALVLIGASTANAALHCKSGFVEATRSVNYTDATDPDQVAAQAKAAWAGKVGSQFGNAWSNWSLASSKSGFSLFDGVDCGPKAKNKYVCEAKAKPCANVDVRTLPSGPCTAAACPPKILAPPGLGN